MNGFSTKLSKPPEKMLAISTMIFKFFLFQVINGIGLIVYLTVDINS